MVHLVREANEFDRTKICNRKNYSDSFGSQNDFRFCRLQKIWSLLINVLSLAKAVFKRKRFSLRFFVWSGKEACDLRIGTNWALFSVLSAFLRPSLKKLVAEKELENAALRDFIKKNDLWGISCPLWENKRFRFVLFVEAFLCPALPSTVICLLPFLMTRYRNA